jgi:ribosome biogenesis protein ERB1
MPAFALPEESEEDGEEERARAEIGEDEGGGDSSEGDEDVNTIGRVPLEWYEDENHIGYDRYGQKLSKRDRDGDALDAFLQRTDDPQAWRTLHDPYNDRELTLSRDEIDTIRRIRQGKYPSTLTDTSAELINWADDDAFGFPFDNSTEPKRRFIPSKAEAKRVIRLVRSIRRGWITPPSQRQSNESRASDQAKQFYLIWSNDGQASTQTATGLSYIPPPKPPLPSHEESYRPPPEYIPTESERKAQEDEDTEREGRKAITPTSHDSLRRVPQYPRLIHERFERCLDLYLCPRTRKQRWNIDPKSLLPNMPKPRDLKPYPSMQSLKYEGHSNAVHALSVERRGQWLATGCDDCGIRVFDVATTRLVKHVRLSERVRSVQWLPVQGVVILAATVGSSVYLLDLSAEIGSSSEHEKTRELLRAGRGAKENGEEEEARRARSNELASWEEENVLHNANDADFESNEDLSLRILVRERITRVEWHPRGDYFVTVSPTGASRAVLVHQLSKRMTQSPFKKSKGRVVDAQFHPRGQPFLYMATLKHIRVYNLAKQALSKELQGGVDAITSLAVHPGGDNLVIGSSDNKVCWFDLDLSTRSYKTLHSHERSVQGVDFHHRYPLFASSSDDGTVHVHHGMVYSDLMHNPLIVPLKVLRGHNTSGFLGVLNITFHPRQPWIFSSGADGTVRLFTQA